MNDAEVTEWRRRQLREKNAAFRDLRHYLKTMLAEKMSQTVARRKLFKEKPSITLERLREIMDPYLRAPTFTPSEFETILHFLELPQEERNFMCHLAAKSYGWRVPPCPIPSSLTRIAPSADSPSFG